MSIVNVLLLVNASVRRAGFLFSSLAKSVIIDWEFSRHRGQALPPAKRVEAIVLSQPRL